MNKLEMLNELKRWKAVMEKNNIIPTLEELINVLTYEMRINAEGITEQEIEDALKYVEANPITLSEEEEKLIK